MKIEDVKVGDRCYAVGASTLLVPVDEHGQNAVVTNIDPELVWSVWVNIDGGDEGGYLPGHDLFWCKPDCPEKPKRKVIRSVQGWTWPVYGGMGRERQHFTDNLDERMKRTVAWVATLTWEELQ